MEVIILPGSGKKYNEPYLYETEDSVKDLFEKTHTLVYNHWTDETLEPDVDAEVEKLAEIVNKIAGKYIVHAKSIGTVITVKAIAKGKINPKKIVLLGCPWDEYSYETGNFDEWIETLKEKGIPALIVQQTNDPFFKYEQLEKFLDEHEMGNYQLIEIEGDNHAYDNYDELKEAIIEFIA